MNSSQCGHGTGKFFTFLLAGMLAALVSVIPHSAMAVEDGPFSYLAGSPGTFVGEFPPIPGLFAVSQTSFTTSKGLYDNNGDKQDLDWDMDAWAQTFRFVASYPKQLFGANTYSQLVLPFVKLENSLSVNTPMGPMEIFDEEDSGLSNVTVTPLILNWHKRDSFSYYTLATDIVLKGFNYDDDSHANIATGYNSIMPIVAYRYDDPEGLDLGVKATYSINMKNSDTDYDSGDQVYLDLVAGWNFGKLKFALVGGYTHQVTDDKQFGSTITGHRAKLLQLGPSLTYTNGPMIVNVNYQKGLIAENTSKNDSIWLNFTLPLYVPGMGKPH